MKVWLVAVFLLCLTPSVLFAGPRGGQKHIEKSLKRPPRPSGVLKLVPFQRGQASWYGGAGDGFHGRVTANGEIMDGDGSILGKKLAITAAHIAIIKAHPEGEWVVVRTVKNNRTMLVWVNDSGPYVYPRILDLSMLAAERMHINGVDEVIIYRLQENVLRFPVRP